MTRLLIDLRQLPAPSGDAGGEPLRAALRDRPDNCSLHFWLGAHPGEKLDALRRAWERWLPPASVHGLDRSGLPADAAVLLESGAMATLAPERVVSILAGEDPGAAPSPMPPGVPRQSLPLADLAAQLPALAAPASRSSPAAPTDVRPALAFVSPLPPERSGIAAYASELLPALAAHYEVTLVSNAGAASDAIPGMHLAVIDVPTFRAQAERFERVVYQLGNSEFHAHMVDLLSEIPGLVVLHDFFLGHLHAAREFIDGERGALAAALLGAHGLPALRVLGESGVEEALRRYPANARLLDGATGVIVHSEHARTLGAHWLGEPAVTSWAVVPHLRRMPATAPDRAAARRALGLAQDAFVVCSFGFLTPSKCNTELAAAWRESGLASRSNCELVYVGKKADGEHGLAMDRALKGLRNARITGFAEAADYRHWLAAADAAVQLRRHTRGESSGTALDCLARGLPLIVNAHGSMAELPAEAVVHLADAFAVGELSEALAALHDDAEARATLARSARDYISACHDPAVIARSYAEALEKSVSDSPLVAAERLGRRIATMTAPLGGEAAEACARELALQYPAAPCWYVDITALRVAEHVTGIERVTEAQLSYLMTDPPAGVRVIPVYADPTHGYREARNYLMEQAGLPGGVPEPQILPRAGDLFLGLDWVPGAVISERESLAAWRRRGVRLWYQVYDILPVTNPEWFPAHVPPVFRRWLTGLGELAHGCVCISGATADRLAGWWQTQGIGLPPQLAVCHLGADIPGGAENAPPALGALPGRYLLMVGTIEPRKGHRQAVAALEQLWREGTDVHLVIVGREGWRNEGPVDRAPVAALVQLLQEHPELGRRLHWYDDLDDGALVHLYRNATALLAASDDEGFGLPLVEAAFFGTPRIVRDIPVFRELAGEAATYFTAPPHSDPHGAGLADVLRDWLGKPPPPRTARPPLTWADSGRCLKALLDADRGSLPIPADGEETRSIPGDGHSAGSQLRETFLAR